MRKARLKKNGWRATAEITSKIMEALHCSPKDQTHTFRAVGGYADLIVVCYF